MRERILKTALLVGMTTAASGQTTWNGATSQSWADPANWSAGVPGVDSKAFINIATGNTPIITTVVNKSATVGTNDLWIGQGSGISGRLDIDNAGSLNTSGTWVFVGQNSGTGTLNVNSGGTLTSDNDIRVGRGSGIGHFNVAAGGVVNVDSLISENAANTFGFTGDAVVTTANGSTTHNMTLTNVTGNISLQGGDQRLAAGVHTLGPGGVFNTSGQLFVGNAGTSSLTIDVDTGSARVGAWLPVGIGTGGNGTLTLESGTLTVSDGTAGSFTTIGANNNAIGAVIMNGGTWNQGGGGITMGEAGTAQGSFTLNDGDLHTSRIWSGNGNATLDLNGGTLHATRDEADFISANVVVDIPTGIAIDTAGFSVTTPNPLGGAGGLTKEGAGILAIDAEAAYTGPTQVDAGTLTLGGNVSTSGVSVAGGAALGVEDPFDTLGFLNVSSLSASAGAALDIETGPADSSEKVVVADAAGLSFGTMEVNLYVDGTTNGSLSGTYTILEYSGTLGGVVGDLSVGNPRPNYMYTFADTGSAITVSVVAPDDDNDGMDNDWETAHGLDPNDDTGVNGADGNLDGDFATNFEEYLAGTAPDDPSDDPLDTDDDGLLDSWEITHFGDIGDQDGTGDVDGDFDTNELEFTNGTDPNLAASSSDEDSDGMGDGWEILHFGDIGAKDGTADSDSDLFTDLQEWERKTDPNNASFSPAYPLLAHRWNFNSNLLDTGTIGGSDATIMPGDTSSANVVTQTSTSVNFAGGTKATSQWVQLGSNLLPETNVPVTIELWATPTASQNWSRVFSIHNPTTANPESLWMSWQMSTNVGTDNVRWFKNGTSLGEVQNSLSFALGTEYHIAMTIEPADGNPDQTTVTWWAADASGGTVGAARGSFTAATRFVTLDDAVIALGRSWWGDNAPTASYNEARLFYGKLPEWTLEGFHVQGADDPVLVDTDTDGLPDAWEDWYFIGDLSYGPNDDPDNDTATNLEELYAGSDPDDNSSFPGDSDADGLPDQWELDNFGNLDQSDFDDADGDFSLNEDEYLAGTDPNLYTSFPDSDTDDMSDGWEDFWFGDLSNDGTTDTDGDGFNELAEFENASSPTNPLEPGVPDGDADDDGLPDRWEVEQFNPLSLANVNPGDDPDSDSFTNLEEYRAMSNPDSEFSTPTDINGDGEADVYVFHNLETTGSGITDVDSEGTPFTVRLGGSGTALTEPDARLDLDTATGRLSLLSSASDINGQTNMAELEAIGIPLSDLGFTGTEDFQIRAHFVDMPAMSGYDQIGAYVGTSTQSMTRSATIEAGYQSLGVNTNGTADSDAIFGAANTATAVGTDMTVIIQRIGGVWSATTNGNNATPGVQPTFLDGNAALQAGVFVLHATNQHESFLESFTVVRFGQADSDTDNDGMDDAWETTHFGSAGARDGTGDFDGDGINDLDEFAFNGDPTNGASQGEGSFSTADSGGAVSDDLTITIAVRAGATFAAGGSGEQVATINGLTYTVRGSADLATWTSAVTHVGTTAASDPAWELHTFRLDASEGLPGKGFLDANAGLAP